MILIPLTRGYFAKIDDGDYEAVSQYNWRARKAPKTNYATRPCVGGIVFMHRFILGFADDQPRIDHRDGDGLNNQRYNLRPATKSQNAANQGLPRNNTSGFKGVYWHKAAGKWMAAITFEDENIYLGLFLSRESAAQAYNAAAVHYFGEFARLNPV